MSDNSDWPGRLIMKFLSQKTKGLIIEQEIHKITKMVHHKKSALVEHDQWGKQQGEENSETKEGMRLDAEANQREIKRVGKGREMVGVSIPLEKDHLNKFHVHNEVDEIAYFDVYHQLHYDFHHNDPLHDDHCDENHHPHENLDLIFEKMFSLLQELNEI